MATKSLTIVLTCCAGAVAAVIGWEVGNDFLFRAEPAAIEDSAQPGGNVSVLTKTLPSANRDVKQDKAGAPNAADAALRGAIPYADNPQQDLSGPRAEFSPMPPPMKPNDGLKNQKPSRAYLNDAQIAGIRSRLKLTKTQEKYWPPVENALRGVVRQISDYQARLKKSRDDTFDFESADIVQLKASAKALFTQLRGDQKSEVISLATMAGVGPVVSAALQDPPPKPAAKDAAKDTTKETASEE